MAFHPIVQRELRAAARRRVTFRVRWWTALLGMAIAFVSLGLVLVTGPPARRGETLFTILSGYAFGICGLAGVFLTADAIAREMRESTLGFLFLAGLRGHEVVLGKFVSSSLNALYALLALLPLTALPFLLGGVTAGQFLRTAAALLNMLFVSLAAGICVSVYVRDAQRAAANTLGAMLLLVVALPAFAALTRSNGVFRFTGHLALASPLYPFLYAADTAYRPHWGAFWGSLVLSHLAAWCLMAFGSWHLARSWLDRGEAAGSRRPWMRGAESAARRRRRRKPLLDTNPVRWLIGDEPTLRRLLWLIVGLWALAAALLWGIVRSEPMAVLYSAKACGFLLKILIALQACRFFAEARTNGALELLLCTPLRSGEILRGQWLALKGIFLLPLCVFLLLTVLPFAMWAAAGMLNRAGGIGWSEVLVSGSMTLMVGGHVLVFVADVLAVSLAGMWLALSVKRPAHAAGYTILFVLVLPSLNFCGVGIVADLILILWAGSKLQRDFRWVLNRGMERAATGRILTNETSNTPPVIRASPA